MYYRLSCVLQDGTLRGYQWREIDQATFATIAAGQRPVGDAAAQTRDSTKFDPTHTNATVYYGHVWNSTGWINNLTAEQAQELYATSGREQAGT
jgi:hypothetical protein